MLYRFEQLGKKFIAKMGKKKSVAGQQRWKRESSIDLEIQLTVSHKP